MGFDVGIGAQTDFHFVNVQEHNLHNSVLQATRSNIETQTKEIVERNYFLDYASEEDNSEVENNSESDPDTSSRDDLDSYDKELSFESGKIADDSMPNDGNVNNLASDNFNDRTEKVRELSSEDPYISAYTSNGADMYTSLLKEARALYSNNGDYHTNVQSILVVLINHLDEHGFLRIPIKLQDILEDNLTEEVADFNFEFVQEKIEEINKYIRFEIEKGDLSLESRHAIDMLQGLTPTGIGSRNQQEYFTVRASFLHRKKTQEFPEWTIDLFKSHYEALKLRNLDMIAQDIGKSRDEIDQAFNMMGRTPFYPSDHFAPVSQNLECDVRIVFDRDSKSRAVELVNTPRIQFKSEYLADLLNLENSEVNKDSYPSFLDQLKKKDNEAWQLASEAHNFINSLNHRQKILVKIANYIIENEDLFISTGSEIYLQRLKQVDCAKEINESEPDVSYTLKDKGIEIETSSGMIICSLKRFFDDADSLERKIQEIIDSENKKKPYSDNDICRILKENYGMEKSRQSIERMRSAMGIPPKKERKI